MSMSNKILMLVLCLLFCSTNLTEVFAAKDFRAVKHLPNSLKTVKKQQKLNDRDRELAQVILNLTNTSAEGLSEVKSPDGGVSVDLQGRFQNVMLGSFNADNLIDSACVASIAEANDFFGRNLETGEKMPKTRSVRADAKAEIAAQHGMSVNEFEFYSNLIAEAARQRSFSPNAATLTIINNDGAGEGFNDVSAMAAEGGNTGTTLGQQRLNLFNFAAGIWGAFLDSSVAIEVRSQFNPLTPCSSAGGVLGSAGAVTLHNSFANAEFPSTWYSQALANKRSGSDLDATNPDINATFNSSVDTGCLGVGSRFYYGLDNTTPSQRINLLIVLLHEMGHGLGFQSFVNSSTGALFSGLPDIYTRYMFDRSTSKYWFQMTTAERQISKLNTSNVLWDGPNVKSASGSLTAGRDVSTGRVQLFMPNPLQSGSSISHFDTAASPNLLMEPAINIGIPLSLDLTRQQMRDIGWYRDTTADLIPDTITNVTPSSGRVFTGSTQTITWTNNGGFARNVTVELSTDGGLTFPTVIASDTANNFAGNFAPTASLSWVVPNTTAAQARIRVREANFIEPAGVSAANFIIALAPSAATANVRGKVITPTGRGLLNAFVAITNTTTGETLRTRSNGFGYFNFQDLAVGVTYTIQISSKRYQFDTNTFTLNEDLTDLILTGR